MYHPLQSTVKKKCGMALYTVHGHNNMITGMFYLSLHKLLDKNIQEISEYAYFEHHSPCTKFKKPPA